MVKVLRAGIILLLLASGTCQAAPPSDPSLIVTPPQPSWSELSTQQKIILAPLSASWDSFESYRQKKWLGIVERFATLAPEEQRRIQAQMHEWDVLSPEERRVARENFKASKVLSKEQKQILQKKWEEYSSLPDEEKQKFQREATQATINPPIKPVGAVTKPVLDTAKSPDISALPTLTPSADAVEAPQVTTELSEDPPPPKP